MPNYIAFNLGILTDSEAPEDWLANFKKRLFYIQPLQHYPSCYRHSSSPLVHTLLLTLAQLAAKKLSRSLGLDTQRNAEHCGKEGANPLLHNSQSLEAGLSDIWCLRIFHYTYILCRRVSFLWCLTGQFLSSLDRSDVEH